MEDELISNTLIVKGCSDTLKGFRAAADSNSELVSEICDFHCPLRRGLSLDDSGRKVHPKYPLHYNFPFKTENCPPFVAIVKMSNSFPALIFELRFQGPRDSFQKTIVLQSGICIKNNCYFDGKVGSNFAHPAPIKSNSTQNRVFPFSIDDTPMLVANA